MKESNGLYNKSMSLYKVQQKYLPQVYIKKKENNTFKEMKTENVLQIFYIAESL